MLSLNALDRGKGLRRWALNAAGTGLAAAAIVSETVLRAVTRVNFEESEIDGGRVVIKHGLALAEISGDPATLGRCAGTMLTKQIPPLLRLMALHPPLIAASLLGRVRPVADGIPAPYRAELTAMALAAGVKESTLVKANLVVDTCCSALVRGADPANGRPLVVARNMDFYPAAILGPATMVSLVRPQGKHAFVSVGWPGYAGVISGMNARGLSVCILLNYGARGPRAGTPIGFRARDVLEDSDDLASATERFSSSPLASSHYLLVADAHGAAVLWQDGGGSHRHDLDQSGWLACSNGQRDLGSRLAIDDRGRCLREVTADAPDALVDNEPWMRRSMTASYLRGINTQAMLFVPEQQRLQIALGTGSRAAAHSEWIDLDVRSALAGGSIADVSATKLAAVTRPATHYTA